MEIRNFSKSTARMSGSQYAESQESHHQIVDLDFGSARLLERRKSCNSPAFCLPGAMASRGEFRSGKSSGRNSHTRRPACLNGVPDDRAESSRAFQIRC